MEILHMEAGAGDTLLDAEVLLPDDGICIYVGGGKKHIGSVVTAQPRRSLTGEGTSCTCSVMNFLGHKDEAVARRICERIATELGQPTVVAAGVHIDNATSNQIEKILANADMLCETILLALRKRLDAAADEDA